MTNRTDVPSMISSQFTSISSSLSSFDISSQLSMLGNLYPDLCTYGISKWKFANDLFGLSELQSMLASLPISVADYLVPKDSTGVSKNAVDILTTVLQYMNYTSLNQLVSSIVTDYITPEIASISSTLQGAYN